MVNREEYHNSLNVLLHTLFYLPDSSGLGILIFIRNQTCRQCNGLATYDLRGKHSGDLLRKANCENQDDFVPDVLMYIYVLSLFPLGLSQSFI